MWQYHRSLLFLDPSAGAGGIQSSCKVAAFDLDSTLIRTKSGRKFPADRHDWKWWDASVVKRIRAVHQQGFVVAIFSNQSGLSKSKQKYDDITGKIEDLIHKLRIPVLACVATKDDEFRKPSGGMWRFLTERLGGNVLVEASFFVGDAAGRPAGWDGNASTKKDFADSDRMFAQMLGLRFYTPEEYFLDQPAYVKPAAVAMDVDDTLTPATSSSISVGLPPWHPSHFPQPELVLTVGLPASGKSTIARTVFAVATHNYAVTNQDTLKTREKCVKAVIQSLTAGVSAIVDNTNAAAETRALYIAEAKKLGIPVRCIELQTDEVVSKKLNLFREKQSNGAIRHVSRMAYNMFKSKYQPPTVDEGFVVVHKIPFVADTPEVRAMLASC